VPSETRNIGFGVGSATHETYDNTHLKKSSLPLDVKQSDPATATFRFTVSSDWRAGPQIKQATQIPLSLSFRMNKEQTQPMSKTQFQW
jgi:hypothetical protein